MDKISENLRKLVIINMVTILVAYAFCFINCTLEIPGRCTDCFTYTGLIFLVGFVVAIMQAILGASLLGIIRGRGDIERFNTMKALAIASIFFAVIQFILFFGSPDLPSHTGYKGIGKALEMLCHTQFIAAKIVNIVFVVINVKIINGASEGIAFRTKEAEELEKRAEERKGTIVE